jgi:hypothetical protein
MALSPPPACSNHKKDEKRCRIGAKKFRLLFAFELPSLVQQRFNLISFLILIQTQTQDYARLDVDQQMTAKALGNVM